MPRKIFSDIHVTTFNDGLSGNIVKRILMRYINKKTVGTRTQKLSSFLTEFKKTESVKTTGSSRKEQRPISPTE